MPRHDRPDAVDKSKLINHRQLAAHFNVHPDTVHRWVSDTDIPHHREEYGISGRSRIRFNLDDVLQWQASRSKSFDTGGSEARP